MAHERKDSLSKLVSTSSIRKLCLNLNSTNIPLKSQKSWILVNRQQNKYGKVECFRKVSSLFRHQVVSLTCSVNLLKFTLLTPLLALFFVLAY